MKIDVSMWAKSGFFSLDNHLLPCRLCNSSITSLALCPSRLTDRGHPALSYAHDHFTSEKDSF